MDPAQRLSAKMAKFQPSLTLQLKQLVNERKAAGLPVFDFGLGETKGDLDPDLRAAGERAFRDELTMYGDPSGLPELRRAVLDWLSLADHYTIDQVIITTGAKQALFNIFLAVCNPADAVLLDAAPWVSYQPLVTAAYGFPVMVLPRGPQRDRLKVSPDDLRRNLDQRPDARLFLLNNPCNPTGQLHTAEEVNALLDVCVERGVYFVLDRLYWRIVFDGQPYGEPIVNERTKPWLIQVDGMSKNFRKTGGLRIGWSVAPPDVSRAMANLQSHYTSGPAVPTQRAAIAAISKPYNMAMVGAFQQKRDLLHRETRDMPLVDIWPSPAAFYSFWDVRECLGMTTPHGEPIRTSDDVAQYLLRSEGVVTAAGSGFMQDGFLRLSFATQMDQIVDGMAATRRALGALRR